MTVKVRNLLECMAEFCRSKDAAGAEVLQKLRASLMAEAPARLDRLEAERVASLVAALNEIEVGLYPGARSRLVVEILDRAAEQALAIRAAAENEEEFRQAVNKIVEDTSLSQLRDLGFLVTGIKRTFSRKRDFINALMKWREQMQAALRSPAQPCIEHGNDRLRDFGQRLTEKVDDQDAFSRVLGEIEVGRFSLDDLRVIAEAFLGAKRSFRTRAEVLRALRIRQRQVAEQNARRDALGKIAI